MADALGRVLGVVDAPAGSGRDYEIRRPALPRTRRSRFLAAAVVVALAPLAVTLCSGAVDARSARGATLGQKTDLARSVSMESRTPAPAAGHGTTVVVGGPAAPLSDSALPQDASATAMRSPAERAALFRAKTPAPRRASSSAPRAPSSPPEDIDFGI